MLPSTLRRARWGAALAVLLLIIGGATQRTDARSAANGPHQPSAQDRPLAPRTPTPTRTPTRIPTPVPTNTPPPSCGLAWNLVASAGQTSALYGVAAVAANDVWAVGFDYPNATTTHTRIQHWNGSAWSLVPSPDGPGGGGILYAVDVVSANDIWAVGATPAPQIIALHWNGSAWSLVSTPALAASYLVGVSAVAANDVWAVGYYGSGSTTLTLTLHWDGNTWGVMPSPNPSSRSNILSGVSAVAANDVWAVGWTYGTDSRNAGLSLHWDGNTWSVVPIPPNTVLYAVEAVAANDVWAVGTDPSAFYPLSIHWNGSTWSNVTIPDLPTDSIYVTGLSARTSTDVWAVGYYWDNFQSVQVSLILHWDGSGWSAMSSPRPTTGPPILNAVEAVAANDVWAVGYAYAPLIQRYHDPCSP